jgi:hypothetical protein
MGVCLADNCDKQAMPGFNCCLECALRLLSSQLANLDSHYANHIQEDRALEERIKALEARLQPAKPIPVPTIDEAVKRFVHDERAVEQAKQATKAWADSLTKQEIADLNNLVDNNATVFRGTVQTDPLDPYKNWEGWNHEIVSQDGGIGLEGKTVCVWIRLKIKHYLGNVSPEDVQPVLHALDLEIPIEKVFAIAEGCQVPVMRL